MKASEEIYNAIGAGFGFNGSKQQAIEIIDKIIRHNIFAEMVLIKSLCVSIYEKVHEKDNKLNDDTIYNNADALQILKVSRRTLQEWRTKGKISFSQVGSKIYYTKRDLDLFMKNNIKTT